MVLKEKEESTMRGSRRLIQKNFDTIRIFVKPTPSVGLRISIYIDVYKTE